MDTLTGPALVKAVSASMPGSNISCVLDKTNDILNQRIYDTLKYDTYDTVFHLYQYLYKYELSDENIMNILTKVSLDTSFSKEFRKEVVMFMNSGLMNSVSKFIEKKKRRFILWCSSKTE